MKFGAHVAGAGSLTGLIEKAKRLEVDCFQMFASPPSNWNKPKHTEEEMAAFKALVEENNLGPNFFHAIYLLNLGSDNPELLQKSIDSLTYTVSIAPKMGVKGVIFHTGSHKGAGFEAVKDRVCDAYNQILDNMPADSLLVIENNAGQGNLIARDADEIASLIDGVKQKDRIAVCIDTCHAFANGTDWRVPEEVDAFVKNFDSKVGWDKVVAIHCNDSKFEVNMNKDRHENLGQGFIGEAGFRNIFSHEQFKELPLFLETPGFTNEGPDEKNLDLLRAFAR